MIRSILNLFLGRRLAWQTNRYLDEIASASTRESRDVARRVINELAANEEPTIALGRTEWKQEVAAPISEIVNGHSLITGGTGAGKTRFVLGILKALIEDSPPRSFGILDAKGELFSGALVLLARRLTELDQTDPQAAESLRNRIVVADFGRADPLSPISPYNILAKGPVVDPGFFAENRADLLLDLLPGDDALSLAGIGLLRRAIMLLSSCKLPITAVVDLLYNDVFRAGLLKQCPDSELQSFFRNQYANLPKQTIAALTRRMDALFSSEAVRLSLSATTAPDFRALQDDDRIVLVNTFGTNLSRGVRRLLQAIVFSDISQAVFARQHADRTFTWFCDEAQNVLLTSRLRDQVHDLLTMSRSFGTFLCLITQNISVAAHDSRLLRQLITNVRWSFSMRGDPSDAAFLKSVLPVTGAKPQPRANPFEERRVYSLNDERTIELDAISHLPDRVGYLWLRSQSSEAIKITVPHVGLPPKTEGDVLLADFSFGKRISREEFEREKAARNQLNRTEPMAESGLESALAQTYSRIRGEQQ